MRIVYDPRHRRHLPRTELLYGKPVAHPDQPERVERIREAIAGSRWRDAVISPRDFPLERAARIHDQSYIAHLQARRTETGQMAPDEEWFPYTWPHHRSLDTGTPLLGVTRDLAWASACAALTAAEVVLAGGGPSGGWAAAAAAAAVALCRPPGHHAARGAMGGYCYFNNAALAADRLLEEPTEHQQEGSKAAILDLDIHHGNGTQDIFYADGRVLYCSIHLDPEEGYPPHTGFAEETGAGPGAGLTYNQPLPVGTGWPAYAVALGRALDRIARFRPAHVVLSQGFDTFEGDRWGGFRLHAEDYACIGEQLRTLGRPVVVVLEGGYEPENLAAGSLALLEGLDPLPLP